MTESLLGVLFGIETLLYPAACISSSRDTRSVAEAIFSNVLFRQTTLYSVLQSLFVPERLIHFYHISSSKSTSKAYVITIYAACKGGKI